MNKRIGIAVFAQPAKQPAAFALLEESKIAVQGDCWSGPGCYKLRLMPIYEYECRHCGHQFELLILPNKSPAASCPACHKKSLNQLVSMFTATSESTRKASFAAARQKSKAVQKEKAHEEHKQLHDHFEDHYGPPPPKKKKK